MPYWAATLRALSRSPLTSATGLQYLLLPMAGRISPSVRRPRANHGKAGALGLVFKGAGNLLRLLGGGVVLRELDGLLLVGLRLLRAGGGGKACGGNGARGAEKEVAPAVFGIHARVGCAGSLWRMPPDEARETRLFVDLQVDGEVVLAIEGADGSGLALLAFDLGPELIVSVLRELHESIGAVVNADRAAHGGAATVLQIDDGAFDRGSGFVFDLAMNHALDGAVILRGGPGRAGDERSPKAEREEGCCDRAGNLHS